MPTRVKQKPKQPHRKLSLSERKIAEELLKRNQIRDRFRLEDLLHAKQLSFVLDPSRFKIALCGRRAGKTVGIAFDLLDTALNMPNAVILYVTLNRASAKKILWPDITRINRERELGGIVNHSELNIKFPNGSIIYLTGAKDQTEIEKFRGLAIKKIVIDEAGSFKRYLTEMIEEVLIPALFDHNGTLMLIGTPNAACAGAFYDACHTSTYAQHQWTMLDNPYLEAKAGRPASELIEEEITRRGLSVNDPGIQREFYGKWVKSLDTLVYRYKPTNLYREIPEALARERWTYVMGIDLGYNDADAIVVWG